MRERVCRKRRRRFVSVARWSVRVAARAWAGGSEQRGEVALCHSLLLACGASRLHPIAAPRTTRACVSPPSSSAGACGVRRAACGVRRRVCVWADAGRCAGRDAHANTLPLFLLPQARFPPPGPSCQSWRPPTRSWRRCVSKRDSRGGATPVHGVVLFLRRATLTHPTTTPRPWPPKPTCWRPPPGSGPATRRPPRRPPPRPTSFPHTAHGRSRPTWPPPPPPSPGRRPTP